MPPEWGLVRLLVLPAMFAYAAAFILLLTGARRSGWGLYAAGFVLAAAAVLFRWISVAHLPMQNLFEVFLVMGTLVFPVSLFCRWFLSVDAEFADAAMGFALLLPVAFIFSPEPAHLPPALQSPLFGPHVAAYLLAYVLLAKAGVQAAASLAGKPGSAASREAAALRMTCFGFPLLTLGLVLGAWWGKMAWGDYWSWDPKELWSLATWLVFLGYLHFRRTLGAGRTALNSVLVLTGVALILVTLLWANLGRIFAGLHSYAM